MIEVMLVAQREALPLAWTSPLYAEETVSAGSNCTKRVYRRVANGLAAHSAILHGASPFLERATIGERDN